MRKRIGCALLAVVMILSLAMCYPVRVVHADALGLEYSMELAELLYTLMINGMLAGGAVDAASMDYDSAMELFDNFVTSMSGGYSGYLDDTIYLPDDCIITYNSNGDVVRDVIKSITDGTGALKLPTKEAWENFRVVQGGAGSGSPGGAPNGDDHFSLIKQIKIGTEFMAFISAWTYNLWTGANGLDPDNYLLIPDPVPDVLQGLDQYRWRGYYQHGVNSNVYSIKGYVASKYTTGYVVSFINGGNSYNYRTAALLDRDRNHIYFYEKSDSSYVRPLKVSFTDYNYLNDGSVSERGTSSANQFAYPEGSLYSLNIPVFYDYDAMIAFLEGTSSAGILNGFVYDFPSLAKSIAEALAPLADIQVAPDVLPEVAEALAEAASALPEPAPDSDPAVNNDSYKEAVQEAVKSTVPEAAPDPDPDPAPKPDIVGTEGVKRFELDLTKIFPFCLPFDLVRLLEAFAADPVAPYFTIPIVIESIGINETVVIDLSILDDVAALFRTGELIAFVICLIFATRKLIKW